MKTASSALDAVFLLDIDNDLAIRRAAGRRIDPVTGKIYHLEFNPPPSNQHGVLDRLVPLPDSANETLQVQNQLAIFAEEELGLKDWFKKFHILRVVDGSQTPADVLMNVRSEVQSIVEHIDKTKAAAENVDISVADEPTSMVASAKEIDSKLLWSFSTVTGLMVKVNVLPRYRPYFYNSKSNSSPYSVAVIAKPIRGASSCRRGSKIESIVTPRV